MHWHPPELDLTGFPKNGQIPDLPAPGAKFGTTLILVTEIYLYGNKIHLIGFIRSPVCDTDSHGNIMSSKDYGWTDGEVTVIKP